MKKFLLPLLAALVLTGCAQTYDGPTTTVRVLSQTRTDSYWDSGELAFTARTVYSYDIYGNQAQYIDYVDDEAISKTVNHYDEKGNLLRSDAYSITGWFPKRDHRDEYTYDDQGRVTSTIYDHGGDDVWAYHYTYDDAQNTRILQCSDGSCAVEYFNAAGHLMRIESTQTDGTVSVTTYTRRPDGQPLTLRSWINGEESVSIIYEYDDQGRPISQTITQDGEAVQQDRWEYDDENRTQTRYASNGSYFIIGYNTDGTESVREAWDKGGKLQTREFYDYQEIRVPAEKEETP